MELNMLAVICILPSIIFLSLALYIAIQYKRKKTAVQQLDNEIIIKEKKYSELSISIDDMQKSIQHLIDLEKKGNELQTHVETLRSESSELENTIKKKTSKRQALNDEITSLKKNISIFSPTLDLINVGFFEEPEYLFDTSDRFKEEIKIIRMKQKAMIQESSAITIPDSVVVINDNKMAQKILKGQVKLMLKAFNVECDKLMASLKPSNFALTLERIDKVATDIEKTSISLKCGFNSKYVELKFQECELQYQYKLKEFREREEQQIIKEQIREEQKAIQEYERAIAKAQKEEKMYQIALEQAYKKLALANDNQKEKLEEKIFFLQKQLKEAQENEQRAKSMAEQTKKGHVYIVSNVGSFGENVYKIGLTRRLDPKERIKELSNASVPFSYDIHAMIYSDDAPALERQLHEVFRFNRINAINRRKEFFLVTLVEIKEKVLEITGEETRFKMTALAEEYYESKKLRSSTYLTTNTNQVTIT